MRLSGGLPLKRRIAVFAGVVQSILLLAHLFVYEIWTALWGAPTGARLAALRIAVAVLAISFVPATLLAHRYFNGPVRFVYRLASLWLGVFNFLFIAAGLSWIGYGFLWLTKLPVSGHAVAGIFFGLAIVASLYGIVNAADIRVRRVTVKLPGLPASWRGRVAALVTDTHLGHIKGYRFSDAAGGNAAAIESGCGVRRRGFVRRNKGGCAAFIYHGSDSGRSFGSYL